jgi:hypothetical protein
MAGPTKHGITEMHKGLAKGGLVTATAPTSSRPSRSARTATC